ncbi:MAG TPA: NUDIX domain-containing protein [Chloroflexota bacterium]|nr:NUDIX domain-containing protein [Chloroflexota bacterium]
MAEPGPVIPRPAAAVTLLRDGVSGTLEVCMVRRHGKSAFMPSVYVFPGGALSDQDRETERRPGSCAPLTALSILPLGEGFYAAAIRECFEEAGVLLARPTNGPDGWPRERRPELDEHRRALNEGRTQLSAVLAAEGLVASTDRMGHWSHWITPEGFPRRFDTHFFLARLPDNQEIVHDPHETTEGVWVTPGDALARFQEGAFPLVYATERQLSQLALCETVAAAFARYAGRTVRVNQPRVVTENGTDTIVLDHGE